MMINSQWDFFPARGTPRKPDSATAEDMSVQWELAGSHHGWKWQYMYGDARQEDLGRAGMLEWGEWQPWTCEPGRIEVPLYMAEKAMYEAMIDWVEKGVEPGRIVASKLTDGKVTMTRPVCQWPTSLRHTPQNT